MTFYVKKLEGKFFRLTDYQSQDTLN